ncbi:MAG: alpha-ketoglutarate-dependent dioxygenase AlkB [Polyangiaceae bacterium]
MRYFPSFLSAERADRLLAVLKDGAPWEREAPLMFGKRVTVRRQTCSFGEPGLVYRYSGVERPAHPWPDEVRALRDLLDERPDYVLCNLYEDGSVGLGWHSDDESDLVRDATIFSVSLGVERDFSLRLRASQSAGAVEKLTLRLAHGSLLTMEGATQRYYQHCVPPRKRVSGLRINLTFRSMARPLATRR